MENQLRLANRKCTEVNNSLVHYTVYPLAEILRFPLSRGWLSVRLNYAPRRTRNGDRAAPVSGDRGWRSPSLRKSVRPERRFTTVARRSSFSRVARHGKDTMFSFGDGFIAGLIESRKSKAIFQSSEVYICREFCIYKVSRKYFIKCW